MAPCPVRPLYKVTPAERVPRRARARVPPHAALCGRRAHAACRWSDYRQIVRRIRTPRATARHHHHDDAPRCRAALMRPSQSAIAACALSDRSPHALIARTSRQTRAGGNLSRTPRSAPTVVRGRVYAHGSGACRVRYGRSVRPPSPVLLSRLTLAHGATRTVRAPRL